MTSRKRVARLTLLGVAALVAASLAVKLFETPVPFVSYDKAVDIPGEWIGVARPGTKVVESVNGLYIVLPLDEALGIYAIHADHPEVTRGGIMLAGPWESVEPDQRWHIIAPPSTGAAARQAPNISFNDQLLYRQWHHTVMHDLEAYNRAGGAYGQKICVVDTGVGPHPDLDNAMGGRWSAFPPPYDGTDAYGHGTHVAGIAAAIANNGVAGIGVGWGASIYSAQVLDASGYGSTAGIARGLAQCRNWGADVANMSLGGGGPSPAMEAEMAALVNTGAVVVCAAGNDNSNVDNWPAASQNCVSVAATDSGDRRASFSNYAQTVDVSAPGYLIWSTTIDGGGFGEMSGTSMASPMVAGEVAYLRRTAVAQGDNPPGHAQAIELLQTTGVLLTRSPELRHAPRIDTLAALDSILLPGPLPTPGPTPTIVPTLAPPTATEFPPGYPSPEPIRTNTPSASWTPRATSSPVASKTPTVTPTRTATPTASSTVTPLPFPATPVPTTGVPTLVPTKTPTLAPPLRLPLPAGCYMVTDNIGRTARLRMRKWAGWLYQVEYCP